MYTGHQYIGYSEKEVLSKHPSLTNPICTEGLLQQQPPSYIPFKNAYFGVKLFKFYFVNPYILLKQYRIDAF